MKFEDLIKNYFEIRDGKFYDNGRDMTSFYIQEAQWTSNEYRVCGGSYGDDYTIKTEQWSNTWYIYRGYSQVCRLNYHGGMNWSKE